jgi:putrescine aminotransferase
MFAVERLGIEPDVLTLAGALGGGVASLGAMLTRRDLWMRAYGSLDSFALHTGVLAGGSLACAAALATLEVLRRGELVANARARGEELTSGLRALGERYPLFREVRGRGLLIGVELLPSRESIFSQLQHLLAGDAAALALPGLTPLLANITAPYLATVLLRAHGICTQLAGPGVLRVQPPLVVTADEVAEFLRAMDAACGEVQSLAMSFDRIVAKSGLGQRSPQAAPSAPAEAPPRPAIPAPSVGGNGHKPATAAKTLTGHGQH